MAKLSRKEMEDVIAAGGSVVHNGVVLSHKEHLPSKAELAQGDPQAEARTAKEIDAEIAKLQAQRATLAQGEAKEEKPARKADAEGKGK